MRNHRRTIFALALLVAGLLAYRTATLKPIDPRLFGCWEIIEGDWGWWSTLSDERIYTFRSDGTGDFVSDVVTGYDFRWRCDEDCVVITERGVTSIFPEPFLRRLKTLTGLRFFVSRETFHLGAISPGRIDLQPPNQRVIRGWLQRVDDDRRWKVASRSTS